jgi:hypothetical protein
VIVMRARRAAPAPQARGHSGLLPPGWLPGLALHAHVSQTTRLLWRAVWRSVEIQTRADESDRDEQPREHGQDVERRDAEAQRADDDGGQPDRSDPAWQRLRTPGSKREHTQTEREHDRRDGVERERRAEQIVADEQPTTQHCQQRAKRPPAGDPLTLEEVETCNGEQEQEINGEIGEVDGRGRCGGEQRGDATQRSCGDGGDTCPADKRMPVNGGTPLSSY